jgi:uncharacterized protein YjbI with pentapeptide repeats
MPSAGNETMIPVFASNEEYFQEKFKDINFENQELLNTEFTDCEFVNCNFQETVFRACTFRECTFRNCNLSLINVQGSSFFEVIFRDSQIVGVNWTLAAWGKSKLLKPFDFINCKINYSTFIGLKICKVKIVKCSALDVDFSEADLSEADCRGTVFEKSRFAHTNLINADFRNSRDYSINANENAIAGAKFSLPEAISLLYSLDIEIEE